MTGRLVLDTHAWVWLALGEAWLRTAARGAIEAAAAAPGRVFVPAIALWEVSFAVQRGRIKLPMTAVAWLDAAAGLPGLDVAPLTAEIALDASRLPDGFHGDPADRMIVATARILDATLVTADRTILLWSRRGHVRVFPASA